MRAPLLLLSLSLLGAACSAEEITLTERPDIMTCQIPDGGRTQLEVLVNDYNRSVCRDRPTLGYLLTVPIVESSIRMQLDQTGAFRPDFEALLEDRLTGQAELQYTADSACQDGLWSFEIRLRLQASTGGESYSLAIGDDLYAEC